MPGVVIFDRDGTLIHPTLDHRQVRLYPGVRGAIKKLREAGYLLAIATNQPGIAKGQTDAYGVEQVHLEMRYLLAEPFAAIAICPHTATDKCGCRKPKPGLLLSIAAGLRAASEECWMVGDRQSDVDAADAAGMRSVLVLPGVPGGIGLAEAAERILAAEPWTG